MHHLSWSSNPGDTVRWLQHYMGTWRQANPLVLADGLYIDVRGQPTFLLRFGQTMCWDGRHVRVHDRLCKGYRTPSA
jgi:hypothetical protein